ncbi:hypothetical protein BSKO_07912 [Bryopsis sp. KO-2023]|nr:hypothetical protein BSKO_07912 [Bryopsis sp. KO-2023]
MDVSGRVGLGTVERVALRPGRLSNSRIARLPRNVAVRSSAPETMQKLDFSKLNTEEEFMGAMSIGAQSGFLPDGLLEVWRDFYANYKAAVVGSGVDNAESLTLEVQKSIAGRVFNQFMDPYKFPSYHERILEPFNYYDFGQKYVGNLVDFKNSVVGHIDRWGEIERQIKAGENVILLANHQTEADPGVFAHMLTSTHPTLAENVIYVAGDRVVTDPMCKPFSMGRNLFCVHSKKHMDDVPELRKEKMAMNRRTLAVMSRKLNEGGNLLWIAPSGGRDRPDADGVWLPSDFDPTAVELMKKLCLNAKSPGHLYSMAMVSWNMMPPPSGLSKTIGERRLTNHVGVGISVGEELKPEKILEGLDEAEPEVRQTTFSSFAHDACVEEYKKLDLAIKDPEARKKMPDFSQPWVPAKKKRFFWFW